MAYNSDMSPWSPDAYLSAYRFAAEAHDGQTYPGTNISYIMHLSFVCMEVMAALPYHPERDGDYAIQCALLHDVLEDTAVTSHSLTQTFGQKVTDGVQALTKDKTLGKKVSMDDSLQRITQQPKEVWMVKLADRISNLAPPPPYWNQEKIQAYRDEAIVIHDTLAEASPTLAQRLQERISTYEQYT